MYTIQRPIQNGTGFILHSIQFPSKFHPNSVHPSNFHPTSIHPSKMEPVSFAVHPANLDHRGENVHLTEPVPSESSSKAFHPKFVHPRRNRFHPILHPTHSIQKLSIRSGTGFIHFSIQRIPSKICPSKAEPVSSNFHPRAFCYHPTFHPGIFPSKMEPV